MKIFKIFWAALFAVTVLTGCDNPEYPDPEGERGALSFDGFELTAVDRTVITQDVIDVTDYVVNVRNSNTGEIAATWTYGEMPAEVELLSGTYIVEAYNAELQPVAWDAPYYYASSQVRVYGKEVTAMSAMQCSLANVKVDVGYSVAFREVMGNAPGATTLVAVLTGTVAGVDTMMQQLLTGIEAGQYYQVTFSLDEEQ